MTTNADEPTSGLGDTKPSDPERDATAPLAQTDADTISLDEAPVATAPAAPASAAPAAPAPATPAPAAPVLTTPASLRPAALSRPPVRWGGIVWGLLLIAFAAGTLIVVSSPARLAGVTVWIASLTPGAAWALWIALAGLVIVVSSLLGAIGAAQRNRRRRPL